MKRTAVLIMALTGLAICQSKAETIVETIDGIRYQIDTETKIASVKNHYAVREGRKQMLYYFEGTDATVPSSISHNNEDYTVALSEQAFTSSPNLVNVSLSDGITTIPGGAFQGCKYLQNINIPETVTSLGTFSNYFESTGGWSGVFSGSNIQSIYIPGSVEIIGDYCFDNCINLKEVVINEGTKIIGSYAFYGNSALENITLPNTIDSIGKNTFYQCNLKQANLSDNIRFIGRTSFSDNNLTEFHFPENLTVIRTRILGNNPISSLTIPTNVIRIMPGALQRLSELKELIFSDGQDLLEFDLKADYIYGRDPWKNGTQDSDFVGNWLLNSTNVERLYLGRNISTWIPEGYEFPTETRANEETTNPFYTMDHLKDITIGEMVKDASCLVFENYPALQTLTLLAQEPPVLNTLTAEQAANVIVNVPEGKLDAYRNLPGWSDIKNLNEIASVEISIDNREYPVEYFDLSGKKIINPENGFYIKKQGNSTEKVLMK